MLHGLAFGAEPSATPANGPASTSNASSTAKPVSAVLEPPSFTLTAATDHEDRDAVLTWQAEPTDARGAVSLNAGTNLPDALKLSIERLGQPMIDSDRSGQPTGTVRQRVRLHFDAIPRRLDSQSILLAAQLGRVARTIEISATNLTGPPSGAVLSVAVPTDLRWTSDKAIGLVLSAQGATAPGLAFAAGPFTDAAAKRAAPIDLCLSETAAGPCADNISVESNRPRNLFVRSRSQTHISAGNYTGTLRFTAGNGLKAEQTIQLEITSETWRLAGLFALISGTLLSLLLTVFFPYWRDRDFALRPFAALRNRLRIAETKRAALTTPMLKTLADRVSNEVQDRWLWQQGKIGAPWPSPFGGGPDPALLKTYLDTETGLVVAIERLSDAIIAYPAQVAALDGVAGQPDLTATNVDAKVIAALGAGVGANLRTGPLPSLTLAQIATREDFRSGFAWTLSSLLSTVLGYVILIDGNPAFGGWTDVVGALLWGLGLSVTGGKLAEVTSGQLRTVLRPAGAS